MNENTVLKIREFNRFYLSLMNFYENHYVGSDYSITESRVLYEIYGHEGCSADDIVKQLHLDKGYLSRIIKRFEGEGILERQKSETDARSYKIYLTAKGKSISEELIQKANCEVECLIRTLSAHKCAQLEDAMNIIREILEERN